MNMQQIGRKISALRKERDMTQNELAEKLGVSYQAVSSWERGLTMPDISKLPDISQVLGSTIDELLENSKQVEIVKNVLTQNTSTYGAEQKIYIDEVVEVAPILKPSQVDTLAEKVEEESISISDLGGIMPFVSQEVLAKLSEKIVDVGDIEELSGIAPFIDRETLDKLARKVETVGGLSALSGIAPFVSSELLGELALKAGETGNIEDLYGIAPFIDRDYLNQLARKIEQVDGLSALSGLAPFISRDVLSELVEKAGDAGDINGLSGIAPFVSRDVLDKLVLKAMKNYN